MQAAACNAALRAVVMERGGHVGFMAGPPWAPRFWAERQVAAWLAAGLTGSA
jgi:hypothetical protein